MEEKELIELRKVVKLAFIRIGIRCDMLGFKYLCDGVELVVLDPTLLNQLCNGLYKKIGELSGVNKTTSVERSIRHAIEACFESKSFGQLNKMFNMMLYGIDDKPTAGELIRLVAEYYMLGLYKD